GGYSERRILHFVLESPFFCLICLAMHFGRVLKMEYCRYGQEVPTDYEVEPLGLGEAMSGEVSLLNDIYQGRI
ncbi:MAG: hypothetical protein LIO91_11960, partial [Bacteroidales bacterium]|nr:hypothetical protein [Bacteroidales bacterium]